MCTVVVIEDSYAMKKAKWLASKSLASLGKDNQFFKKKKWGDNQLLNKKTRDSDSAKYDRQRSHLKYSWKTIFKQNLLSVYQHGLNLNQFNLNSPSSGN